MGTFSLTHILLLSFTVTIVSAFKLVCDDTEAELHSDANLTCQVHPKSSLTEYVKISLNITTRAKIVYVYRRGKTMTEDMDSDFIHRTKIFEESLKMGQIFLTIYNVTENDRGRYTCLVKINEISGEASITLTVKPKKEKKDAVTTSPRTNSTCDTSQPDIIGGSLGGVVAFVIICAFIYHFVKKRNQGNQQAYELTQNQPHDQGQEPLHQGQEPLHQGQEPLHQGQEPLHQGQEPLHQGQEPLNQGQEPLNQGQEPLNQGQEPLNQRQEPPLGEKNHSSRAKNHSTRAQTDQSGAKRTAIHQRGEIKKEKLIS